MTMRLLLAAVLAGILCSAGCATTAGSGKPRTDSVAAAPTPRKIDPQRVQGSTMSFASRYVVAMADACERAQAIAPSAEARGLIVRTKLVAGMGAMGNAVNPNPIVGLMDMAMMVNLTRATMELPTIRQTLGPACTALFVETLTLQEQDVWRLAGEFLTEAQITQLKDVAKKWVDEHPGQEFVGGARLADFPESKQADNPALKLADNIFGLVRLDPFTGLDPAVRQVEESRILAERMFFYLQNMPTLVSWQTDALYYQMLAQPQMAQFFKDASLVSANTTGFTKASADFADACGRFATTIEVFRKELPEQQATLVKQVNDMLAAQLDAALKQSAKDIAGLRDSTVQQLDQTVTGLRDSTVRQLDVAVAGQREAALRQASSEIGAQRDAAIKQLAETVTAQQDLLAKNTQALMDSSIDQLYARVRSLVLVAAGSLLAVLVIFRLVSVYVLPARGVRAN